MNAKLEFMQYVDECGAIKCAVVCRENDELERVVIAKLKLGYTEEEYNVFLDLLDFEYDNESDIQDLSGTIWFTDGTWSSREYGSNLEQWTHYGIPTIPAFLVK